MSIVKRKWPHPHLAHVVLSCLRVRKGRTRNHTFFSTDAEKTPRAIHLSRLFCLMYSDVLLKEHKS